MQSPPSATALVFAAATVGRFLWWVRHFFNGCILTSLLLTGLSRLLNWLLIQRLLLKLGFLRDILSVRKRVALDTLNILLACTLRSVDVDFVLCTHRNCIETLIRHLSIEKKLAFFDFGYKTYIWVIASL